MALTFMGYSSLWAAAATDGEASLPVIFNGLRLLRMDERDEGCAFRAFDDWLTCDEPYFRVVGAATILKLDPLAISDQQRRPPFPPYSTA